MLMKDMISFVKPINAVSAFRDTVETGISNCFDLEKYQMKSVTIKKFKVEVLDYIFVLLGLCAIVSYLFLPLVLDYKFRNIKYL
jgi:hypothetical protein